DVYKRQVFYTAPRVRETTDVDLVARFPGSAQYSPSEAFVTLTVEYARPAFSETLFFFDFSSGTPKHNGDRLSYKGRMVMDFSINGVTLLELRRGESVEFRFAPGAIPEEAVIYLWVQGDGSLEVRLNGNNLGTVPATPDLLSPSAEQRIIVASRDFVAGTNVLRLAPSGGRSVRLQRVIIAF
ncbi:MAG: hypothetical protein N2205_03610, partial [Candidatus Caldatribacterium sp.]|nr:hypothetical protein [Candidatus Caldatribacterium sp.]